MTDIVKIRLGGERSRYTVQGFDERYIVCTKPFNLKKTYSYSIVDVKERRRGDINLIFGVPVDVNTCEGAAELLEMMRRDPELQVSHRNTVDLSEPELAECLAIVNGGAK